MQLGTGIVAYGNRLNGNGDILRISNGVGKFMPAPALGIPKLLSLRNHILSIADEIKIEPDDLATFTDSGVIESQPEGSNLHFQLKYNAIIIITDFADNPLKLFYWILQWMRINQPNHTADAIKFESDQLDDKKTDLQITIALVDDIKITNTDDGIKLYSTNEPDLNPVLLSANNWTMKANDETIASWINGG